MPVEEIAISFGFALVPFILLITLIGAGSGVLLGFCVYYDAKYNDNENAVLWGVLSGFFSVAAVVYLILKATQKQKPYRCRGCGEFLFAGAQFCTRCGRPLDVATPEQMSLYDKRRRLFLWLWIGALALSFVIGVIFGVVIAIGLARIPFYF